MAAASPEAQDLLTTWRNETDFVKRDALLEQLVAKRIFPQEHQDEWEIEGGLYPGLDDPNFLPKMMRKQEYFDTKQPSVKESLEEGKDRCRSSEDFELSPTQRFVSRLLNPRTPFHSALLFHGVGVGKTCAAVTICESYLNAFPGRKAFVVAPKNIQSGFMRTLFDMEGLRLGTKPGEKNHHRGCTGDTYLALTNSFEERSASVIQNRVTKAINKRYEFFGYNRLYNYIFKPIQKLREDLGDGEVFENEKRALLRRVFSNRMIVIDEAHNLRDNPMESDDESLDDASVADTKDSVAGKLLTPQLRDVLTIAEDITLVLMTATPMYNSYLEIVFLLNLLLLNDKRPTLKVRDIFDTKTETFVEGGAKLLGRFASNYISYMRGENPLTFPLRLEPEGEERLMRWPNFDPKNNSISREERERSTRLPCLAAYYDEDVEESYKEYTQLIVNSQQGLGIANMNLLVQAGNWVYPGEEGDDIASRVGVEGFTRTFELQESGQYKCIDEELGASWLSEDTLNLFSAKTALLLKRLRGCKGVAFVYSRFKLAGALSIALALEANGYLPYNGVRLLAEGNQNPKGLQCAFCEKHQSEHADKEPASGGIPEHKFRAAKYVILTGDPKLSPDNKGMIDAERRASNAMGGDVKVVLGSQIAGEGLDLKYIREVFVFDSWYHLNKLEQVIGRGIRNCSHAALDESLRNCTISLLVNAYRGSSLIETIDEYSYRYGLNKARVTGMVTRVLKEYALDCSLNRDAILVTGLDPIPLLYDSQGTERTDVNRNDVPYTSICDWLDVCDYQCRKADGTPFTITGEIDTSTYDEFTAQSNLSQIRRFLQAIIAEGQAFLTFDSIAANFPKIPRTLLASLLSEMVMQKDFKIRTDSGEGRIIYKNGYYMFQPDAIEDTRIPIALRLANLPIPRDRYAPAEVAVEEVKEEDIGEEDSSKLWDAVMAWAATIRAGTAKRDKVPAAIEREVSALRDSAGIDVQQQERLQMIHWIYNVIYENEAARARFAGVVLEYMWDEFITTATKREALLHYYREDWMRAVARDAYWEYEGNLYLRILNGQTNEIEYFCPSEEGYERCPSSVVKILDKESMRAGTKDPLLQRPLTIKTTGYMYGFMNFNPTKGKLVFKKGVPPDEGKKVGRGAECSISSGTSYERGLLKGFGDALRTAGKPDLNFTEVVLKGVQNAVRVCTLGDLALRYMDKEQLQGKRWFYRPLEAKMYKHPLR